MKQTASAVRGLARQILTLEGSESGPPEARVDAALRAFEKLCMHLSKLVGKAGFQALLSRALTLAGAEVRCLESVQVTAEGALERFSEIVLQLDANAAVEGSVAILGQLLGLLVTFIGEDLTLRLVQDVWPEAALNVINAGAEETPE